MSQYVKDCASRARPWSLATAGTQECKAKARFSFAHLCRDSAIDASIMALAAPEVLALLRRRRFSSEAQRSIFFLLPFQAYAYAPA